MKNEWIEDFLFGNEEEIVIKRRRNPNDSTLKHPGVTIGDRNLFGVEKIELIIEAGKPLKYKVEGTVLAGERHEPKESFSGAL